MTARKRATASILRRVVVTLTLSCAALPLLADTPFSGNITSSTTWTFVNSPYVVTGTVVVAGAASPILTIEPGVTVKFNPGGLLMIGNGAAGKPFRPGYAGVPNRHDREFRIPLSAGFWAGLQIMSQASAATQCFSWVTVRYAGTGSTGGIRIQGPAASLIERDVEGPPFRGFAGRVRITDPVDVHPQLQSLGCAHHRGSPTLNSSTSIATNTAGGISIDYPGSASLQTVSISAANTGYAISQSPRVTLGTVSSVTATGNTTNAVEPRSNETVDVNTTWKKLLYYVINNSSIWVGGASTPVLTIAAGVTIKFAQNVGLGIGIASAARLVANGTAAQPIVLTANAASPSPGYWSGLQNLGQRSVDEQAQLRDRQLRRKRCLDTAVVANDREREPAEQLDRHQCVPGDSEDSELPFLRKHRGAEQRAVRPPSSPPG